MNKNLTKTLTFKYLKYLFNENDFKENSDMKRLKLDTTSLYSITPYKYSVIIPKLIKEHTGTGDIIITDACACIGADTITFCKNFKKINAIELCPDRFGFLKENLELFGFKNYRLYNNDALKIIKFLKQDLIYLDMPWSGRDYKNFKEIDLYLSGLRSYEICNLLKDYTKYIVLKVPNNFIFEHFKENIHYGNYFKYDLEKFQLIIIY
jgi:adenine-specific DNA methylase